ncbi:MAG: hypothetical protein AABX00_01075 [Nanoarchaeota archaeon]
MTEDVRIYHRAEGVLANGTTLMQLFLDYDGMEFNMGTLVPRVPPLLLFNHRNAHTGASDYDILVILQTGCYRLVKATHDPQDFRKISLSAIRDANLTLDDVTSDLFQALEGAPKPVLLS